MNGAGGRFDAATLAALEYPKVIQEIAQHATCAPGRAAVSALAPYDRRDRAEADLALVDDAAALFVSGRDFAFPGAIDVRSVLDRARVGAALSTGELHHVSHAESVLSAAQRAIAAAVAPRASDRPLAALAAERRPTDDLVRRIDAAIGEDGSVLDSASPELARVRRRQRSLAEEIRRRVEDIVRNPNTARLLSETLVTIRGGRYVVPVRAEHAAQFPGVVHDQSASGATIYVEPMACVEANNSLRSLEAAEERETARILSELSALAGAYAEALAANGALLARLDCIGARARWAIARQALRPKLLDECELRIVKGRHPLLRRRPVPLDIELGTNFDALVISGPNMGGKTVVLKTVGLFCLLAYAGIPLLAAAGTQIGWFEHIACVIGDDQSIANDLSSFSAHLQALRAAQLRAGPHALVLVDEIGNGTEPSAGAALAQAFIEALLAAGALVIVTTHFTQLKVFAASRERVSNASMTFDAQTRRPAYALALGVPGQSLAFALARSIDLDAATIDRAEALFGADAQNLEQAFAGLAEERARFEAAEEAAALEMQRLRAAERELRSQKEAVSAERAAFERRAAETLERSVQALREELLARAKRSERDARRRRAQAADDSRDAFDKAMREIRASLGLERAPEPGTSRALAAGDAVFVRTFGKPGIVTEVYARDVLVTMGTVKAMVGREDVELESAAGQAHRDAAAEPSSSFRASESAVAAASQEAQTSVDIRGMRVDEATPIVDKALDDATLAGLPVLRIIHGKGTGQLGRGVREFLRGHPHVERIDLAPEREGGSGVTIVTLH